MDESIENISTNRRPTIGGLRDGAAERGFSDPKWGLGLRSIR